MRFLVCNSDRSVFNVVEVMSGGSMERPTRRKEDSIGVFIAQTRVAACESSMPASFDISGELITDMLS